MTARITTRTRSDRLRRRVLALPAAAQVKRYTDIKIAAAARRSRFLNPRRSRSPTACACS